MTEFSNEKLAELRAVAESQAAAHERMLELNGGVGMLGVRYPEMFEDMLRWGDSTENEHADTVLALIDALEAKTAEVEGYRRHFPCDGGCNYPDGPQEECSLHGSNPRELWEVIGDLARERDEARAEAAELRAAFVELAPSAAIMPTTEVVVDGDVFTWGDLPGVLSRTRESLTEAQREAKGQYIKRRAAEAALEQVRALHRKAHAIFSWSEGGVRYEEPCENCNGAPGVHDCGCWADVQVEYVCAECDRGKGKHRDSGWPCPTVQAIEGADDERLAELEARAERAEAALERIREAATEVADHWGDQIGTHYDGCWRQHAACLAAQTLAETGADDA